MVTVVLSKLSELPQFVEIEHQAHARNFVTCADLSLHQQQFVMENFVYLTIQSGQDEVAGFFLLKIEQDNRTVEFARIAIDERHLGVGQDAIKEMEAFVFKILKKERIWLDVYEDNLRGKHVYEKLGYRYFKMEDRSGRGLLFYEKTL